MGWTIAVLLMGITTCTDVPNVFGEEAKQTAAWNLSQEDQDLINVTNGDILGERCKDGAWEFHLYTTDGYQEMANGELVYVFGYTHAKGSFKNVGEVTAKEQVEQLLEPVKVPSDPITFSLARRRGSHYITRVCIVQTQTQDLITWHIRFISTGWI